MERTFMKEGLLIGIINLKNTQKSQAWERLLKKARSRLYSNNKTMDISGDVFHV